MYGSWHYLRSLIHFAWIVERYWCSNEAARCWMQQTITSGNLSEETDHLGCMATFSYTPGSTIYHVSHQALFKARAWGFSSGRCQCSERDKRRVYGPAHVLDNWFTPWERSKISNDMVWFMRIGSLAISYLGRPCGSKMVRENRWRDWKILWSNEDSLVCRPKS